jgi:predicted TIM-barrel fold metal-dependent hydrolase
MENLMETVDCHAHVFAAGLPLASDRRYTPEHDARVDQYLAQLDAHGIARGVLIQPSFLGTDNSFMCAALRAYPARLRGIAVVEPGISPATLDALAADGVVGIRLNLIGHTLPELQEAGWRGLLAAVAARGWHVEVHRRAADLEHLVPALLAAGVDVVIDHFGRPDPALGVDDPGFRYLLSLGHTGRVWVKLSGAYRNGADLACAAIPMLRQSFGLERLVWGSDWPHTLFETEIVYADTRSWLDAGIADPADRSIVLCTAPAMLYGWSQAR